VKKIFYLRKLTWAAINSARAAVTVAGGIALVFGVTLSAPVAAVIAVGAGLTGGYLGGTFISDVAGSTTELLGDKLYKAVEGALK
jgi:hypothetical protein